MPGRFLTASERAAGLEPTDAQGRLPSDPAYDPPEGASGPTITKDDPALVAIRKQTQAIRDSVRALQQSDLASRQLAAEDARRALDTTFRLTSGTGLTYGTRSQDDQTTLLSRAIKPVSSTSVRTAYSSSATPYAAQTAVTATEAGAAPTATTALGRLPSYKRLQMQDT